MGNHFVGCGYGGNGVGQLSRLVWHRMAQAHCYPGCVFEKSSAYNCCYRQCDLWQVFVKLLMLKGFARATVSFLPLDFTLYCS